MGRHGLNINANGMNADKALAINELESMLAKIYPSMYQRGAIEKRITELKKERVNNG